MNDEDEKPSQFYKYLAVYMSIRAAEEARQKRETEKRLSALTEGDSTYRSEAFLQAYENSIAPTPQNAPIPPMPSNEPSIWLWLGIMVSPVIFAWFTLRKQYHPKYRLIAFGYMILFFIISLKLPR